jgi:hypothetical protein
LSRCIFHEIEKPSFKVQTFGGSLLHKARSAWGTLVTVRELKAQGMRPVDIAKTLKIGRASVYRVLAADQNVAPSSLGA